MNTRRSIFPIALALSSLAVHGQAVRSQQTPLAASAPTVIPALVPFSGAAAAADGKPLTGEVAITFLIFKEEQGGEPLWVESQAVATDAAGRYKVQLGATNPNGLPSSLFASGEARWLEIQIAGESSQPRVLLASVPYALKAADAATLGGLPASAFALAGSNSAGAVTPAAIHPNAAGTTVTTTGGTANKVAKFSGASTIVNSILYDNGTEVGIGTTLPTATLTVDGTLAVSGTSTDNDSLTLITPNTASTAHSYNSPAFKMYASVYDSSTKAAVAPHFEWQVEPTGNNTATPNGTLNLLATSGVGGIAETGLYLNSNGTIHFAPGQTFPGATGAAMCIATAGGFGDGGTTFVGPGFAVPAAGSCTPWSGFTKTATTVVLFTSGAGCLSSDGKKLTLSVASADPSYLGPGTTASDFIQLTRTGTTGSFTTGSDTGEFSGSADQITCTSSLLQLNEDND